MQLRGFPGITFMLLPNGKIRVFWREEGRQHNRTFKKMSQVIAFARIIYPKMAQECVHRSKIAPAPVSLLEEIEEYPLRLVRTRVQPDSRHPGNAVATLMRIVNKCQFQVVSDITTKALDKYAAERCDHPSALHHDMITLVTFLGRLREGGVEIPDAVMNYRVPKPESQHIHVPWSPAEIGQWWRYISRGMEVLAGGDPTWSWHERIQRMCHSVEFGQRMRLVALYLPQSRYMVRPSESRRLTVECWNRERRILATGRKQAKRKTKQSFVDVETAWLLDVCAFGGDKDRPLLQSPKGMKWTEQSHYGLWRTHLDACGLSGKMPYDVKYNTATHMFENPELFEDKKFQDRIDRVRAITGHDEDSKSTELYIKTLWGSVYHSPVMEFYNRNRIFPFLVEDFPVPPEGEAGAVVQAK